MNLMNKNIIRNQKGITMLEILIAITILSILVTSFFSAFIYSAKVNKITEETTDTTYIAQKCMEELYKLSTTATTKILDRTRTELVARGYTQEISLPLYKYKKEIDGFYVLIKLDTAAYTDNLYKVVVSVFNDSGYTKLSTKMEDILTWQ